jgi:flagellar basal body-associated protein FliL
MIYTILLILAAIVFSIPALTYLLWLFAKAVARAELRRRIRSGQLTTQTSQ